MDWRLLVDAVCVLALCAALVRVRRDSELIEQLRKAFTSDLRALPHTSLGSAIVSASRGIDVGGDVFDVYDLDGRYGVFMIADVSGKGVGASADTGFIRHSMRTFAIETGGDPAAVLTKFNTLYQRIVAVPESFVVAVAGKIDTHTGEIVYANAGHEPAYVKHRDRVTLLAPTGPVLGVFNDVVYRNSTARLESGDVLILATDGITETRDTRGTLLGAAGLGVWIARTRGNASQVAGSLMAAFHERIRGRVHDDVALLVLRYEPEAAPARLRFPAGDADTPLGDVTALAISTAGVYHTRSQFFKR
ncbi:MAG: PP2C family protein-serine/threonine phosphatase [Candidatus Velthaea sp.]